MFSYDHQGGDIDYHLVFFDLEFKVNFDDLLQNFTIKVLISKLLKYINSNMAVVFGT